MHRLIRTAAQAAGLLGGMSWVLNLYVDADRLSWTGMALLVGAAGLVGAGISRLLWLTAITALSSATLSWALVELVRGLGDARVIEAVLGAGAALLVGVAVMTATRDPALDVVGPPRPEERLHRPGNHRA